MIGNMIPNMMVKPFQSPLFDSPANHGLDYEDVAFQARDGVTLRGWLIKGGTKVVQHEVDQYVHLVLGFRLENRPTQQSTRR